MGVRQPSTREAAGQHFLRSKRLAAALVADAGVSAGDFVLEIGGGTGILTRALADAGARVLVLERDPHLAAGLRSRFGSARAVVVVEGDANHRDLPSEPFTLVANLPFNRSGALLDRLLRADVPLRGALVIVQWELAAKQAAVWPSTLRSTYWRAWYEIEIAGRLARTTFAPPPSVEAAVLRVVRRKLALVPDPLHEDYRRFLAAAFERREPVRRGLRHALTPLEVKRLAPALGFSPEARPWDLDANQWAHLFAASRLSRGSGRAPRPPRRGRSRPGGPG